MKIVQMIIKLLALKEKDIEAVNINDAKADYYPLKDHAYLRPEQM